METIKLQDFARMKGVTDRSIQRHIKKHSEELNGHIFRKGPAGTWLDEYAQNFLEKHISVSPIVLADSSQQAEIERLRKENEELKNKLIQFHEEKDHIVSHLLQINNELQKELFDEKQQNNLIESKNIQEKDMLHDEIKRVKKKVNELRDENSELQDEVDSFKPAFFGFYRKK